MTSKKAVDGGEKISPKSHLKILDRFGDYVLIYNKNLRLYFIAKFKENKTKLISNLINRKHDAEIEFNRIKSKN